MKQSFFQPFFWIMPRFLNELIKHEQTLKFSKKPLSLGECGYRFKNQCVRQFIALCFFYTILTKTEKYVII